MGFALATLDVKAAQKLEEAADESLQTRALAPWLGKVIFVLSVSFALYHYITAGFGVPVDYWHMGIHLSGVLLFVFVSYPLAKRETREGRVAEGRWRFGGVPFYDWILAICGLITSFYIGLTWHGIDFSAFGLRLFLTEQTFRQGDPQLPDIIAGSILIIVLLEAVRRTLGLVIPVIILLFSAYAIFGQQIPIDILRHPGIDWPHYINNMYFPQEGIFGVSLWVISTVVFHFVLFGVIAQRMGLGQLFVDVSTVLAGRYSGGLAKVSVLSSAFFGTISGSSIANTVSTGSLTIPNMKKMGYPGHFAGGVEAAASAGGQITPPIMGAAAFVMAEFLEVSYTTIVIAAVVPAAMHYLGVLSIVHFKAKRLNLRGMAPQEIPKLSAVLKKRWPTALPLFVLIYVLFSGYSPFMAAFWGITTALTVGFLNPMHRVSVSDMVDACATAVKYALAVGAVCAAIGIIVGVVNTTGLGFRLGFLVTSSARDIAEGVVSVIPLIQLPLEDVTLFVSLVLIAITCILMGAGLPTTALYIMLATVAQPALASLGVPAIASHFFVLYYGVISEITPPVCSSAYAAAGIAGANPFRTGVAAFTLGAAKLMVPMVFVYSPSMLIVVEEYFTWADFLTTTATCALGIFLVAVGITGYLLRAVPWPFRVIAIVGGVLMVAPSVASDVWALVLCAPIVAQQILVVIRERNHGSKDGLPPQ